MGGGGQTAGGETGREEGASLIRGQLISRYWLRWTGDDSDNDLYETLSLDIGDPDRHPVTGHLLGRVSVDLDGGRGEGPFASLDDSYNGAVTGHLYDAYIDLHRVPGLALVRAGRQIILETPELAYLDGLRLETESIGPVEAQFGVYGGAATRLFEASPDGDWMAGLYGQCRPWQGSRVRLDYMHLKDETLLGDNNNDLVGVGVWQTIARRLQLEAGHTWVEGRERDVKARAAWLDPEQDLLLQFSYYQLLRTQRELVVELDPFFSALNEYFPFRQFGALVGKGLHPNLRAQVGADLRRVSDSADVGIFNRDYDRWFATLSTPDLLIDGLTLSVTADYWDADQQDVRSWGGDASMRCDDRLTASLGTYYSLYKYDLLLNQERDHVRTYYVKVRHVASKALAVDLGYELEDNDLDLYHMLRLGVTWRF